MAMVVTGPPVLTKSSTEGTRVDTIWRKILANNQMCELSTADGFVEINESLGDMIKYVANEPSVGLYYIQQHAQNAVPNVIRLKNNVTENSHEVNLHTEDLQDSIDMTRSMKECGFTIIDEMIRDIKTSLTLMSTKEPVRGVIQQQNSSYHHGSSPWSRFTWANAVGVQNQNDVERGGSYFSNVFKSAKEKAGNLRWPPPDLKGTVGGDLSISSDPGLRASGNNSSTQPDEADELPVSCQVKDEMADDSHTITDGEQQSALSSSNDYDEFKADREARLEEWLKGSGSSL